MSDKSTSYARNRAIATTAFFGAAMLIALSSITSWEKSWALVLFYVVLLANTYLSIRCFASITPKNHAGQQTIDILLAFCMLLLVFNFNSVINFMIISTMLFIIATIKYIGLVSLSGYSKLLHMKIRIDALGTLYCFAAVLGTLQGYGKITSAIWAVGFVLANIYVLWHEPHYNLENHHENIK